MIETERLSIGQISSGFGRSGNRRAGSLRGWFVDHAEVRRTISAGHDVYKCQWIVSHWSVDDPADGASESPSELAPVSGGGVSRWIHNISSFEYEIFQSVRDGARWMAMFYLTGSVALGYLGVWMGALLTARR